MRRESAGVVWPLVAALVGFALAFGWRRAGTYADETLQRNQGRGALELGTGDTVAAPSSSTQPHSVASDVARVEQPRVRTTTAGANAATPVAAPPDDVRTAADEVLVFGRVTLANQPVANALVAIDDGRGTVSRTATDTSGRYAFAAFAPGAWMVQVSAPRAATKTFEHDARADREEVELDVVLEPCAELLVYAVDPSGAPLASAAALASSVVAGNTFELFLTPEALPVHIAPRDERSSGLVEFTILGRPDPRFAFIAEEDPTFVARFLRDGADASHVSLFDRDRLVAHTAVAAGQSSVVLTIHERDFARRDAVLQLRTVDASSGEPLVSEVAVEQRGGGSNESTTEDGRLRFEHLQDGWADIDVRSPGHALVQRRVYVESGVRNDLGDIPVPSAVVLRGRALDEEGRGAIVMLEIGTFDEATGGVEWRRGRRARSDGEGAFEVTDVAPATLAVRVEAPSYVSSTRADPPQVSRCVFVATHNRTEVDLVVPVESGTLVRLRRANRLQPVLRIVALDEHGIEVGRCRCGGFVNDDALALAIGTYTLVAYESDRETARRAIDVRGEPFDVVFE